MEIMNDYYEYRKYTTKEVKNLLHDFRRMSWKTINKNINVLVYFIDTVSEPISFLIIKPTKEIIKYFDEEKKIDISKIVWRN